MDFRQIYKHIYQETSHMLIYFLLNATTNFICRILVFTKLSINYIQRASQKEETTVKNNMYFPRIPKIENQNKNNARSSSC